MTEIILTDEQAKIVAGAMTAIGVRDRCGKLIGTITPLSANPRHVELSAEQIAERETRLDSKGPWYTTEQVLEHLHSLESK
jgi:hypothetical protein